MNLCSRKWLRPEQSRWLTLEHSFVTRPKNTPVSALVRVEKNFWLGSREIFLPKAFNKVVFHFGSFVPWPKHSSDLNNKLNTSSKLSYTSYCLTLKYLARFLKTQIKQTLHCLLSGFPISPLFVLFYFILFIYLFIYLFFQSIRTTSPREFPFVFVQRICEQIGNKEFVLVTKEHSFLSANGLDSLKH